MAEYASQEMQSCLRRHNEGRLGTLRNIREGWVPHWRMLAEVYIPRRYRWLISANQLRGSQLNSYIVDETGLLAARVLASGMMTGLTSPNRPWFRLGLQDLDEIPFGEGKQWLAEIERRLMRVLSESNAYNSLAQMYLDGGVFGTAPMVVYEDADDVIRCYVPMCGEYFLATNRRNDIDVLYREYTETVSSVVSEFGLEHCSTATQIAYKAQGAQLEKEVIICHAVEPNNRVYSDAERPEGYPVPPSFSYRECYWEKGSADPWYLDCKGFHEKPFVVGRWDVQGNEPYGRSPGMDALGAANQLQTQARRKAEAIEKLVRPPMVASASMRNEPKSILPGGVNYVADVQGAGFKPAYQVDPRLQEMLEDIQATQDRVKQIFFWDLFLMISQLDTVRTATEIDARKEEKLIQLGPVVERWMNEVLDPFITRVFAIMQRRGLIPPPPAELSGHVINIQYISMLAESQRVSDTIATERVLALTGNLSAVYQPALDNFDVDFLLRDFADKVYLNPKGVRSDKQIAALRDIRAKQAQQQQMMEQAPGAADAAKTLSDIQVGGGQSALQLMTQQ